MKVKLKKIFNYWWLGLVSIFLLALFLRLWHLGSLPKIFFVDEVLSGYVGHYILQNGVDIYNHAWPKLYFNNFGDYYIIGPMYLDGLSTFIFGVNQFAVRLPTALMGALLAPLIYYFTWLLWKKRRLALIAAFFVAISPWHIVLSRATSESVIETTLLVTTMIFLLLTAQKDRVRYLFLAAIFTILAYLTYHTARILSPLIWFGFFISWILINYSKKDSWLTNLEHVYQKQKKLVFCWLFLILFFFSLTAYISRTPWGRGRFDQTSIFSQQSGVSIRMTEMTYNLGPNKIFLARIFHNKILGYSREFLYQYFSYFSPNYLLSNGWQKSRYAVPEVGPNLNIVGLLMILGLIVLFQNRRFKLWSIFLLLWLLFIAPIPVAFTVIESPNVRRSLFLLIPLLLLASIGVDFLFDGVKNKWGKIILIGGLSLILTGEFIFFGYYYVYQSDLASSLYRADGYKQVADYVSKWQKKVDFFYLPARGFLPLQYLFFSNNFDKKYASRFQSHAYIKRIDNLRFIAEDCPSHQLQWDNVKRARVRVIDLPSCDTPKNKLLQFQLVDQIHGVNSLLKFKVYHVSSKQKDQ